MNDPRDNPLREKGWRRKLTAAEEAELRSWLEAHPEARAEWEVERSLTRALDALPDVPVPGNFTARAVQAVERETATRRRRGKWSWRSLLPRFALASLVAALGVVAYNERASARREELARSLATFSQVTSAPGPEVLKDFEAIRRLASTPRPDEELLALLSPPPAP